MFQLIPLIAKLAGSVLGAGAASSGAGALGGMAKGAISGNSIPGALALKNPMVGAPQQASSMTSSLPFTLGSMMGSGGGGHSGRDLQSTIPIMTPLMPAQDLGNPMSHLSQLSQLALAMNQRQNQSHQPMSIEQLLQMRQ